MGLASHPLRIRALALRRALQAEEHTSGDPIPSRVLAEDAVFGELRNVVQINDGLDLSAATIEELLAVFRGTLNVATGIDGSQVVTTMSERTAFDANPIASITARLDAQVGLDARLVVVLDALAADTLTLDAALTGTPLRTAVLVDTMVLMGVGTPIAVLALLSDGLVLADFARRVFDDTLNDPLVLADSLTARVSAMETLLAETVFADTLTGLAVVTALMEDGLELDAGLIGLAKYLATVTDSLEFAVGFVWEGEPMLGLSLNTANRAVGEYSGLSFNALATYGGRVYGANNATDAVGGLYRLEGDDDAGEDVHWELRLGLLSFGTGKEKRLDAAYIATTAAGRVVMKTRVSTRNATTGAIEQHEHWNELIDATGTGPLREGRFKVGRGLKSVFWGPTLASIEPSSLGDEIHTLTFHPLILDRRIP